MILYIQIPNILIKLFNQIKYIYGRTSYNMYVAILKLIELFKSYIAGDLFANIISACGLIVAIYTLVIGGKKVSDLLSEYNKKRNSALFGFYANMNLFITRLRMLTSDSDNKPFGVYYLLSPNESLRNTYQGFKNLGKKLSDLSYEFLKYLSSSPKQIPPATSLEEWKEWQKDIKELVEYLNCFYTIGSEVYYPDLKDENAVADYHGKLQTLLNKIETIISNQYIIFFSDIEKEEKKGSQI